MTILNDAMTLKQLCDDFIIEFDEHEKRKNDPSSEWNDRNKWWNRKHGDPVK